MRSESCPFVISVGSLAMSLLVSEGPFYVE